MLRDLFLLTAKPFLYVFNCDQDELADEDLKDRMRQVILSPNPFVVYPSLNWVGFEVMCAVG